MTILGIIDVVERSHYKQAHKLEDALVDQTLSMAVDTTFSNWTVSGVI